MLLIIRENKFTINIETANVFVKMTGHQQVIALSYFKVFHIRIFTLREKVFDLNQVFIIRKYIK